MAKKVLFSDQRGAMNPLLVPLILVTFLVIGAVAFGVWAFGQRQDFKNNVDQKIVTANQIAVKAEDVKKDAAFAAQLKNPLKTYNGPTDFGSVQLSYPKTWSAYVDLRPSSSGYDAYFNPDYVPGLQNQGNTYALRLQVIGQSYDNVLQQYTGIVKQGKLTSTPYKLPKLSSVVGTRLDGPLTQSVTGSMVILPLRDKTLKIWTESNDFITDFNNIILANFQFSP